jgi:hypothetical protein
MIYEIAFTILFMINTAMTLVNFYLVRNLMRRSIKPKGAQAHLNNRSALCVHQSNKHVDGCCSYH